MLQNKKTKYNYNKIFHLKLIKKIIKISLINLKKKRKVSKITTMQFFLSINLPKYFFAQKLFSTYFENFWDKIF